jgi:hypothetical protein
LAAHEHKAKKLRKTRAALNAAAAAAGFETGDDEGLALLMGQQRAEENEDLRNELTQLREIIKKGTKKSRAVKVTFVLMKSVPYPTYMKFIHLVRNGRLERGCEPDPRR